MTAEPPAPDKEDSIIIVSDVHLGGSIGSHDKEFCEFLSWIKTFPKETRGVQCTGGGGSGKLDITFAPLTKLILLGDIIDLWDPEKQDRKNVILESLGPFSILHTLPCDKIYVTGNHDADLWQMVKDEPPADKRSFPWGDGHEFSIYPRHYPPPEKDPKNETAAPVHRGLMVNQTHYTFLHGHQFDGEQIPYVLSEIFRAPFDPVDTLMDLANMSVSRILNIPSDVLLFCLWAVFLALAFISPPPTALQNAAVVLLSLAVTLGLLLKYPDARQVLGKRKPRGWERAVIEAIFLVPVVALFAYLLVLLAWPGTLPPPAVLIVPYTLILTVFTGVIVIPRLIGFAQRKVYDKFKSRDKTVKEVLDDGFVDERDTIRAEVIVFGHTHYAGYEKRIVKSSGGTAENPFHEKLFINTGCWCKVDDKKQQPTNTFVYINRAGLYLLEWKGPDKISCLFFAPREKLQSIVP